MILPATEAERLYPSTARQSAREVYARLSKLAERIADSRRGGEPLRDIDTQAAQALTDSVDLETQYKRITALADAQRKQHIDRLLPLAKDNFPLFCEVMSPDEPPTSPWLTYLTGKLQEIEYNPKLNNLILNVPPGHAKPLWVDSPVMMGDGRIKRLGDIEVGDCVLTHRGAQRVSAVHEQGEQPCVKITTKLGRVLYAAPDHPFMRPDASFTPAGDLRPGDGLVTARITELEDDASGRAEHLFDLDEPPEQAQALVEALFGFVGFHDACGYLNVWTPNETSKSKPSEVPVLRFFTTQAKAVEQARADAKMLDLPLKVYPNRRQAGFACNLYDRRELDVHVRCHSTQETRRTPAWVFAGSRTLILRYLTSVLNAKAETITRLAGPNLRVYAKSEGFLRDLQRLLHQIGVRARVEPIAEGFNGRHALYLDAAALGQLYAQGFVFTGTRAEVLAAKIAERPFSVTGDVQNLDADAVESVETVEPRAMRCLTVPKAGTFVCDGVVVKNSTYASRLFVVWRMGRNPDLKVLGASHTQQFVEKEFSKKIRDMTQTAEFAQVFPDFHIDPASKANGQWNVAGSKGQYVARGIGQGIHGFRFNMAVIDDPYPSIAQAKSAAYRAEVETFIKGDIGTRMLPGGIVFLVMTRFHSDDCTQALLDANSKLDEAYRYTHLAIPAICFDPDSDPLGRQLGERLWDFYSYSHFQTQLANLGYNQFSLIHQQLTAAVNPDSLASKFQHYTVLPHLTPEALAEIKPDPITGEMIANRRSHFRRVVLSVDTANTDSERADFTVVQVWGETTDRKHYLMDQKREKVDFPNLVALINRTARRWEVDAILVESKGNGLSYIQDQSRTNYQQRKAPAPVIEIKVAGNQGKAIRMDSASPMIEAGEVFVPINAPWIDGFMQEFGQCPSSAHDDQVDACSQYLNWARSKRSRFGAKKVSSFG